MKLEIKDIKIAGLKKLVKSFTKNTQLSFYDLLMVLPVIDKISYSEIFNVVLLLFFFPKREIFLKELNDRFGISESFLIYVINLLKSI